MNEASESAKAQAVLRGQPMVSCILPTRLSRARFLPVALASFLMQTHENTELIVAYPAADDITRSCIDVLQPRIVRLLPYAGNPPLGVIRNMCCEAAQGAFIAHFDDDDYSAPGRLEYQLAVLKSNGAAVSAFYAMKFVDLVANRWFQFDGGPVESLGTSLFYLRDWWRNRPFPAQGCGEDQDFARAARSARRLHTSPDLNLMYATAHPGNTSPRALTTSDYKPIPEFTPPAHWLMHQKG